MKTIVIYKSKTGFTKKYAEWIANELAADIFESSMVKVKNLMIYDNIVFGGGLYAGGINGAKLITQNLSKLKGKKIVVFATGASPARAEVIQEVRQKNFTSDQESHIGFFYLRGGFNYSKLNCFDKILMTLLKWRLRMKKQLTSDDKGMLASYDMPVDFTRIQNIDQLINIVTGQQLKRRSHEKKYLDIFNRIIKKGIFPSQFAFTLLIPLRNIFISPKKLIHRLELKENYNVLEIGPGPGYFSPKVAKTIPYGKLVLADIQKGMLDITKKRLDRKKIFNVEYHLCDGAHFPFESNKFNVIFMVTVLGEIENKHQYVSEFHRLLCVNGILSISEQAGDPDKMSVDEIKRLLHKSGFIFDKFYGTKNNFTINFRKK